MSKPPIPFSYWQTQTPTIPEGKRQAFWCACRYGESGPILYRVCEYLNRYKLEFEFEAEPSKQCEPVADEENVYRCTGWFEPSCDVCDTQYEAAFNVLAWQGLPRDFVPE